MFQQDLQFVACRRGTKSPSMHPCFIQVYPRFDFTKIKGGFWPFRLVFFIEFLFILSR